MIPTSSPSKNYKPLQTNAFHPTAAAATPPPPPPPPPFSICKPKLIYSSKIVFPTKHGGVQAGACSINPQGIIDSIFPSISLDIAKDIATQQNLELIDLGQDAVLSPGLVDVHTHISELGRDWEGYHTATKAAAAGGITTLMGMPLNSIPATTTVDAFKQEVEAAGKVDLYADVGLWGGAVPLNCSSWAEDKDGEALVREEDLEDLLDAGVFGLKAFLAPLPKDAGYETVTVEELRRASNICGRKGIPILVHCEWMTQEEQDRQTEKSFENQSIGSFDAHVNSRPALWEQEAVEAVCQLAEHCHVHIVHLSDAGCLDIIEKTKKRLNESQSNHHLQGNLTVETCPHYLLFDLESLPHGDTRYKCFPPIRQKANQDILWHRGLLGVGGGGDDGMVHSALVDMIASDHSPCSPHLRLREEGNVRKAWGGLTGLQYQLLATYTALDGFIAREQGELVACEEEERNKYHHLQLLSKWWSEEPSKLVPGLSQLKGQIDVGYMADLCAWDSTFVGKPCDYQQEHHRWKGDGPYANMSLKGRILKTFLRGVEVYDGENDSFLDEEKSAGSVMIHF